MTKQVNVEIVNNSGFTLPKYQTLGAAGMDVQSIDSVSIHPNQTKTVGTGLFVKIPEGYEIQVRSRSGLAFKNSIHVLNSPGTLDSDYRGEIKVILHNSGSETFEIGRGDRIAQLVLNEVPQIVFVQVESLDDTERGTGGFGSTGV